MAASKECRDVNECSQTDVTGIVVSCGDNCKRPSTANDLFCRFKNGTRSSATYDVESSTFKCDTPNVSVCPGCLSPGKKIFASEVTAFVLARSKVRRGL